MMYNRRDFIKQGLATLIGLAIPITTEIVIEFVDTRVINIEQIIGKPKIVRNENNVACWEFSIDENKMWDNVRLVDNFGNEWQTNDKGITWSHGRMSFNVSEYQNSI